MLKVGSPWVDQLHVIRDAVLAGREERRALRAPAAAAGESVAAFFAGRSVLVTGGCGFLGRCLVELLLRTCPDVGPVLLVVRPKRGVSPQDRVRAALDVPLFDRLRAEQPEALSKVVAVAGDIAEPGLGLSEGDRRRIVETVSVVFSVAATVRFNEPLKKAVLTNTRSAVEMVALAREMPQLKVLQHVSTAYTFTDQACIEERNYSTPLDWRLVLRLAEEVPDPAALDALGSKVIGFQPNTYTFSKALAEQVMNEASSDIPIVTVRPSIVTATFRDPMPGWVDNLYGFAAFWVLGKKGILRSLYNHDPTYPNNIIPADLVTKTMLLAAWARGTGLALSPDPRDGEVPVVHSVAEPELGIRLSEMEFYCNKPPRFPGAVRYASILITTSALAGALLDVWNHLVFGVVVDLLARAVGQKPQLVDIYRKIAFSMPTLSYFVERKIEFKGDNQWYLQTLIYPAEEKSLCMIDILNAKDTRESHERWIAETVLGILRYCLKEKYDEEKSTVHQNRLWWVETAVIAILGILLTVILYKIYV